MAIAFLYLAKNQDDRESLKGNFPYQMFY